MYFSTSEQVGYGSLPLTSCCAVNGLNLNSRLLLISFWNRSNLGHKIERHSFNEAFISIVVPVIGNVKPPDRSVIFRNHIPAILPVLPRSQLRADA